MEVECALLVAPETEHVVTRVIGMAWRLHHLVCESEAIQFQANAVHAFAVMIAWGILTCNSDKVLAKSQDIIFVGIKNLHQGGL